MEQKSSNSMKETKMGNQGSSFINDPLFYGKVNMDPSEKAQLHSGDKACNLSFLRANLPCNFNATPRSTQGCKE
jgi:hypothetical protein